MSIENKGEQESKSIENKGEQERARERETKRAGELNSIDS